MTAPPADGTLPVRARLAGRASTAVSAASRRLHLGGGSVIGGRVGLLIAPDLLGTLAAGRQVALVTGTNGKTTTTRLLAAALGGAPRVATSAAGANLPPGLAVALASAAPGVPAVLEVDEGYLGVVAQAVQPEVVALLNLSRDQLDRVSEVRMVAARWRNALGASRNTTVVANADDPLVVWGAQGAAKVVWVAAGQLWRHRRRGLPGVLGPDRLRRRRLVVLVRVPTSCARRRASRGRPCQLRWSASSDSRSCSPGGATSPTRPSPPWRRGYSASTRPTRWRRWQQVADVEGRFATVAWGGTAVRLLLAKNPAGWTELLDLLDGGYRPRRHRDQRPHRRRA